MNSPRLRGEIESPRPLRATGGTLLVHGWCLLEGLPDPPPVRLVTEANSLMMSSRCARPDLPSLLPAEPAAATCGFTIEGRLPPGIHQGSFEAQLPGGHWQIFKRLTLAVESAPLIAALDEPVSEGTLRDRVKVGGWALDRDQPVRELSLRYGHREIPCVINGIRPDVAAAFPAVPHAGQAGFTSEDFLLAGHGAVRVRARLEDGRTVIAPTNVCFSIATDENHGPELELSGARIGLETGSRPPTGSTPAPTAHHRNILFILPGSFASNSALHVAALAEDLAAFGHACLVAVAHDPETIAHLDRRSLRGLTHDEAEGGVRFANGCGPDVIHAWTTRENVRQLSEKLRARHSAKVVVHLEDNELQILALSLGRPLAELERLPAGELDRLVPPDLSHPARSRGFLAAADGVTVVLDKLRELVPAGKPCATIRPAADERCFYPRPIPTRFRAALQLAPGTTVLFYHGNVHAANAAEMRELYTAVLALNRTGTPVTLIRTGLDQVDFLGPLAGEVAPHVLALGQILHHRHLAPLMSLADIFVQPGAPDAFNDYRFPSKLPEFFAVGRPVVMPRTNLGTTLRHGIDAYVLDRADAAGIAGAVRELRADPALAERLTQGALAYAGVHFSWRRSAEALANFYRTLAAS